MSEAIPLLHNMSAPPKSVVRYSGLAWLAQQSGPGGPAVADARFGSGHHNGQSIRFELPPMINVADPLEILGRLGFRHCESEHGPALKHLQGLINERAGQLPLPEGCAVIKGLQQHPEVWDDPLAALAILTKCTDTVWLRGKTPTLSNLLHRRCVSLLVPQSYMARIRVMKK